MIKIKRKRTFRKPFTSRGKQVVDGNAAVLDYRRAMEIALYSAFGQTRNVLLKDKSYVAFMRRREGVIALRPRTGVLEVKKAISDCRISLLKDKIPERGVVGKILPRSFWRRASIKSLLQFCRLGRALPKIPVRKRDLVQHYERMTTPHMISVDDRIIRSLEKIRWPDLTKVKPEPSDFFSSAACSERKRAEGGRASLLKESGIYMSSVTSVTSGMTRVLDYIHDETEKFLPAPSSLDCTAVPIAELGAKVRIVTKHPATIVAKSHRIRRGLWPLLTDSRNITVSETLSDPELSTIRFESCRTGPRYQVFSADLTAATDYLGWPVISLVCDLAGIPFELVAPCSVGGKEVERGTAMGLPASWCILSLVHYAICYVVDKKFNFRIKGDDLIALWTSEEIDLYYELCDNVGFRANPSKSVISQTRGIFCEVSYKRLGRTLVRQPDFSIRSFVKNEPLVPDQWMLFERHGVPLKKLSFLFKNSFGTWISMAKKARINVRLPRSMAGLGFPPSFWDKPVHARDRFIVNVVHNGRLPSSVDMKSTGKAMDLYSKHYRKNIKWTAQGGSHFNTYMWNHQLPKFLFRAAFIDISNGVIARPDVVTHKDIIRRLTILKKDIKAQKGHSRGSLTYRQVYDIADRMMVTRGPAACKVGFTQWSFHPIVKGMPMSQLRDEYDKIADSLCSPQSHRSSKCKADACTIIKRLQTMSSH